jgi:hypothetical protein
LQLQDAGENLGTVTINLRTGNQRVALQETFDSVSAPNLPAGWTTSATGAQDVWKTSERNTNRRRSAHSAAAAQVGVNEMTSLAFPVASATAELTFYNRYDLETTFLRNKLYDGAVLEIKIGEGIFQDIIAAGGVFTAGGYDGVIDSCCQNPLAGRAGWSGKSGPNQTPEFIRTNVKLPARAAGKNVSLRWRVGTDNGTAREGQYIDDVRVSDGYVCACQTTPTSLRAPFDFDGDGKTDLSVFRPTNNSKEPDFYVRNSSNNFVTGAAWGGAGDEPVNADYDGDGRTDYAVFRPSTATWFVLRSCDNVIFPINFGLGSDELVPGDYDGDGKTDIGVFRPSSGVWYIRQSSDAAIRAVQFGTAGDLPVPGDYDGDNKTDVAVFRPSNGAWYVRRSSDNGFFAAQFGQLGDKPVAGEYDGDGKSDLVVFRPSNGAWYLQRTAQGFSAAQFGANGDKPLQADFDGDGKRDIAVYRPSTGVWYYIKSSDGAAVVAGQFGIAGSSDIALPTIYVP